MAPYEILTFFQELYLDQTGKDDLVETFIIDCFLPYLKGLHESMMEMDMDKFERFAFKTRDSFSLVVSEEMTRLVYDQYSEAYSKNNEKVIGIYLRFLQKCVILKKELEDYVKRPIVGVDIEAQISETKKKFGIIEAEKENKCNASCSGCNIF